MKKSSIVLIVLAAIVLIGVMWFWGNYNGFIRAEESVNTAWSQVETQYQRRYDLIPNLVNAVKGTMAQEREVFEAIADARTRYAGAPAGSQEQVEAANGVESALSRLLVIMENYPVLQSNQTVIGLMDELTGTENQVAVERRRYNEQVRLWNVRVKVFPKSILANMYGFEPKTFFESEEGSESAPEVNLEFGEE